MPVHLTQLIERDGRLDDHVADVVRECSEIGLHLTKRRVHRYEHSDLAGLVDLAWQRLSGQHRVQCVVARLLRDLVDIGRELKKKRTN